MTTTTMPHTTHIAWADVTLGEFAGINLLLCHDAEDRLNRYWDETHHLNVLVEPGDTPTRLTADGRTWLADLRRQVIEAECPCVERAASRELTRCLGTLAVMGASPRRG